MGWVGGVRYVYLLSRVGSDVIPPKLDLCIRTSVREGPTFFAL